MDNTKLLSKFSEFAGMDKDDPNLVEEARNLEAALSETMLSHRETAINDDFAKELLFEVEVFLWNLSKGKKCSSIDHSVIVARHTDRGIIDTRLSMHSSVDGLLYCLLLLVMFAGIKKVIFCQGCSRYFFTTKTNKKTCTTACKQRVAVANRSPEKVAEYKLKRQERYKK